MNTVANATVLVTTRSWIDRRHKLARRRIGTRQSGMTAW
jgi:hypothetical protein